MSTAKKPRMKRRPQVVAPEDRQNPSPERDIPAAIIDTDPFLREPVQGMTTAHATLPSFAIRQFLRRLPSAEMTVADVDHASAPQPTTPTPNPSRPLTPLTGCSSSGPSPSSSSSSSPSPQKDIWRTPESNRTVTTMRLVEVETSPASSRSSRSIRSVGVQSDVGMLHGAYTVSEIKEFNRKEELRSEIRASVADALSSVAQSVRSQLESERAAFADQVSRQAAAAIRDDLEALVCDRVERAVASAALEEAREESAESASVGVVRERLRRMSDEARVRVFCTRDMLEILQRLALTIDAELRTDAWTVVPAGEAAEWR